MSRGRQTEPKSKSKPTSDRQPLQNTLMQPPVAITASSAIQSAPVDQMVFDDDKSRPQNEPLSRETSKLLGKRSRAPSKDRLSEAIIDGEPRPMRKRAAKAQRKDTEGSFGVDSLSMKSFSKRSSFVTIKQSDDPNHYLKEHLKGCVNTSNTVLSEWINSQIGIGVDLAHPDKIYALNKAVISESFGANFIDLIKKFNSKPMDDAVKVIRETDGVALLDCCFEHAAMDTSDSSMRLTLFEFMMRLFETSMIPTHEALDALRATPTDANKTLFLDFWEWWHNSQAMSSPNHVAGYLGAKWCLIGKLSQISYEALNRDWGDIKHLQNSKITTPSKRTKHSMAGDIRWALLQQYRDLCPAMIKLLLDHTEALMHEEIFEVLNNMTLSSQGPIVQITTQSTVASDQAIPQFVEIFNLVNENPYLIKILHSIAPRDREDALPIDDYVELCKGLAIMGQNVAHQYCLRQGFNLSKARVNLNSKLNNRENDKISNNAVNAEVAALLECSNESQKVMHEKFEVLAGHLEETCPEGTFRKQPLQTLICATLTGVESKFVIGVIPPGTGKSFIVMQLAYFYSLIDRIEKVIVLTSNPLLENQLDIQIRPYLKDRAVIICTSTVPPEDSNSCVVIVDEADDWVAKNAVAFRNGKLTGLYALQRAFRVYMLTATATEFLKDMVKILQTGKPSSYTFEFKSKAEYSKQGFKNHQIGKKFFKNADKMLEAFKADVVSNLKTRPVIVFTEDREMEIAQELKKICGGEFDFRHIATDDDAITARDRDRRQQTGVYLLNPCYARGYDLKLQKDAITLVLAFEKGFSWSQVNQMVGRACRSFGVSTGIYYTYVLKDNCDLQEQLRALEPQYQDGPQILKMLYNRYGKMTPTEQLVVRAFYDSGKWAKKVNHFERDDNQVFKLVNLGPTVSPRPSDDKKNQDVKQAVAKLQVMDGQERN